MIWLSPLSLVVGPSLLLLLTGKRLGLTTRRGLQGLLGAGLLLSTPLAANLQIGWQERSLPATSPRCAGMPDRDIVLLTAGFARRPVDAQDHAALSHDSLLRLMAAVQLQRQQPTSRLLIVGGGGQAIAESTVSASLAQALGVPALRVAAETRSQSTWTNAVEAARWQPGLSQPFTLVTSAVHMRRAVTAFSAQGLAVCPHASDYRFVAPDSPGALWPQASAIAKTETLWHEWLGSLVYAWRTRGDNGREPSRPTD